MRRRRENKKLLRLNDEENKMLMELCERYSMGVNEMLRYLIRKEYERITQNNTATLGQLDVLERKEKLDMGKRGVGSLNSFTIRGGGS